MVNILAIIVVSIISMIIGSFWYSPAGFGKAWMKLVKLKKKDMKPSPWLYVLALAISALMFTVLAYFINVFRITSATQGMALSAMLWLGFIATKEIGPILWERKSLRLFLINSSYSLVTILIGGAILAVW